MKSKLAALLVFVGVTATGIAVYTPADGVTRADLLDAGITEECSKQTIRCVVKRANGYKTIQAVAMWCPDAGAIVPASVTGDELGQVVACRPRGSSTANESKFADATDECACRKSSGTCTKANGTALEFGRIAGPNYPSPYNSFSGAGCQRIACEEFAGDSVWPANCPREDAGVPVR